MPGISHKDFVDGATSVIGWTEKNIWPPGQSLGSI